MHDGYRLTVDIGGTLPDFALLNTRTGAIEIYKTLTTPDDPSRASLQGIDALLGRADVTAETVQSVIHGKTLVTNALIERKGARVGLLTSCGFRDSLATREEARYDIDDLMLGVGTDADGVDAICYPTSTTTIPVEIFESTTAAFVVANELIADTAGAGRMRGGHGLGTVLRAPLDVDAILTAPADVNQQGYPSSGLNGGHASTAAEVRLDDESVATKDVPERLGALAFTRANGCITLHTAGGDGYGGSLRHSCIPRQKEAAQQRHEPVLDRVEELK